MERVERQPDVAASGSAWRFVRHFLEMLAAMGVGMLVLGMPASAILDTNSAAVVVTTMAVTMTVPMVAWMRFRRHRWRLCCEMAAAMAVPAVGALVLLAAHLVGDAGTLLMIEHVAMLPSMLTAMLLRRTEYTARHEHGDHDVGAAARS